MPYETLPHEPGKAARVKQVCDDCGRVAVYYASQVSRRKRCLCNSCSSKTTNNFAEYNARKKEVQNEDV